VGSDVGNGVGVGFGAGVGPNFSKKLLMKSQKLSHQLFQSKIDDSEVASALSFAVSTPEDTDVCAGVTSDSMQVPFTTWASVQFSAWA
jgi:hypothetical protein